MVKDKNKNTMRVQEIAKELKKAGLKKKVWSKKENCLIGDYEIREFNYNGIHSTVNVNTGVFNKNNKGQSIECIMTILNSLGLKTENRNGVIAILK